MFRPYLTHYWLVTEIGRQFQFRTATVDPFFVKFHELQPISTSKIQIARPKNFGGSCFKLVRESVPSGLQSLVFCTLCIAFSSAKIPEFFGLGAYFLGPRSTPKLVWDHDLIEGSLKHEPQKVFSRPAYTPVDVDA